MADKILNVKIKQRYDTERNWKSKDPVLLVGEMAISSDKNGMYKVGNGSSKWSELSYSKSNIEKSDVTTALGYTPPTTNSTYSTGTSSYSGTTKLYTGTGSATDGTITQKAITDALSGKSNTSHNHDLVYSKLDHTHNYAGSATAGGSATSAVKLNDYANTNQNIKIGYNGNGISVSDIKYIAGYTSGDNESVARIKDVSKDALKSWLNINKEAYLEWGGKNHAGTYGPIDAAMIQDLGANRFAFIQNGVKIEYSRDAGVTWTDYTTDPYEKSALFGTHGGEYTIGKASSANGEQANNKYMLRVTIDTDHNSAKVYSQLNKFAIYVSTNGSLDCYCTIDASLEQTPDNFETLADNVRLCGWSGWNIINIPEITTYGNNPSKQYGLLRFTFGYTGNSISGYKGLTIKRLMAFGGVGWSTPSNMALYGTVYDVANNQTVYFPSRVYANNNVPLIRSTEDDASLLMSQLPVWTAEPNDDTYFIRQDTGGGASFGKAKFLTLWNYIKSKVESLNYLKGGKQTTTSTEDGGENVYTFSDGSTVKVRNGSTGPAGTSVTVSNVNESTVSGGSNIVTFSDGKKVTIKNGVNGTNGANGITPTIKAASGTSIDSVGTPTVTASTSGATTTFTFNNLKGQKGDKGDPGVNATTTSVATTSANGLMSSTMVSKLNGIADNANNFTYTHPSYTSRTKGLYKVAVDGSGHVNDVTAVTKDDITGLGITYDDVGAASSTHNHTTSDINWKDLSMSIRPESGSDASLEVMLKAGSSTIASNILPSVGQNNPGLMSVPMFRLLNNLNNDVSNLNKTFLVNADEPSSSLQQDGDIWFKFTVI